jgi:hypothetical protein
MPASACTPHPLASINLQEFYSCFIEILFVPSLRQQRTAVYSESVRRFILPLFGHRVRPASCADARMKRTTAKQCRGTNRSCIAISRSHDPSEVIDR